jgi:hypothetical protein
MATIDLRCGTTLHGRLTDNRWFEVKCKRRACGFRKGIVILHTIDITSGQVVSTKSFAEPQNRKKEGQHAADNARAAVRAS